MALERGPQPSPAGPASEGEDRRDAGSSLHKKQYQSLTRPHQFSRAYREGVCCRSGSFKLYLLVNGLGRTRLGISAPRGLRATERNRLRRLFREAYRGLAARVKPGVDIVFAIRQGAKLSLHGLVVEMEKALEIKGILDETNSDSPDKNLL